MFPPKESPITHFGQEILRGAVSFSARPIRRHEIYLSYSWNANLDLLVELQSASVL